MDRILRFNLLVGLVFFDFDFEIITLLSARHPITVHIFYLHACLMYKCIKYALKHHITD